jgi:hypothetical protein
MKNFHGFIVALLCLIAGYSSANAAAHTDMQAFLADTQRNVIEGKRKLFLWWIPNEYWNISAENDPDFPSEMAEQFTQVLGEYFVVAVMDVEAGPFGGITKRDSDKLRADIRVVLEDGQSLAALDDERLPPDVQNFFAMMKPFFGKMLGALGQSLELMAFKGTNGKGGRIVDPTASGNFSVKIGAHSFGWKLPLVSLLPPKYDPRTGEMFAGDYNYNPYTGTELKVK